jgi:type I restriction enzyme S subunit
VSLTRVSLREIQAPKRWALNGGPFGSKLVQKDYVESGVPVVRGGNLSSDSRFDESGFVFVTERKADDLLPNNAHPGDLVFTQRGTLGQIGMIPEASLFPRYVISQSQMKLTVDRQKADPAFVYYVFKAPETVQRIHNQAFSSGVPHINLEILRSFEIDLPELPVQRRIASILSGYDDLIGNNSRRIRILKEIAKTTFDGALHSHPGNWSLVPIREVYEGLFDGPHATPKPSTDGPIFLGIKNVTEQGELDLGEIRHIAEDDFARWTRRVLPQFGDIVFSYEATLNRYAIINRGFRGCLGRRLALIRPNRERIDPFMLLRCLLSADWRREVQSKVISGATVDRIPLIAFPSFSIRVPNQGLQGKIAPLIRSCEELAENCRLRNDVLRTTRDLLLSNLISGEIPVEAVDESAAELMEEIAQPA